MVCGIFLSSAKPSVNSLHMPPLMIIIMTRVSHEVGQQYEYIGYRNSPEIINRLQKNVFFFFFFFFLKN